MPVYVCYSVQDVDEAIASYTGHLGFSMEMHSNPGFARLKRSDLRLLIPVKVTRMVEQVQREESHAGAD